MNCLKFIMVLYNYFAPVIHGRACDSEYTILGYIFI